MTQIQNKKRNGNQDPDRLRDLPERLEFTDNPEDTEVPAPANISQEWHQGSTVLKLTSQKTEIAKECLRTRSTRAPCRRRTGEAPQAEKVW